MSGEAGGNSAQGPPRGAAAQAPGSRGREAGQEGALGSERPRRARAAPNLREGRVARGRRPGDRGVPGGCGHRRSHGTGSAPEPPKRSRPRYRCSKRRLLQRGANASHLAGVNGGPAAEDGAGFIVTIAKHGSDFFFLLTKFERPRLKCPGSAAVSCDFGGESWGTCAPDLSEGQLCMSLPPRRPQHPTCGNEI